MNRDSLQTQIRAADRVRRLDLEAIVAETAWLTGAFHDQITVEDATHYAHVRDTYSNIMGDAHLLAQSSFPGVQGAVRQLQALEHSLRTAEHKLSLYEALLYHELEERLGDSPGKQGLEAAKHLFASEEPKLLAAGRDKAAATLRDMINDATGRVARVFQERVHKQDRDEKLGAEFAQLQGRYDVLEKEFMNASGDITASKGKKRFKKLLKEVNAYGVLVQRFEEKTVRHEEPELLEASNRLVQDANSLEHHVAELYQQTRTHWKQKLIRRAAFVAGGALLTLAGIKLAIYIPQVLEEWKKSNHSVAVQTATPTPIQQYPISATTPIPKTHTAIPTATVAEPQSVTTTAAMKRQYGELTYALYLDRDERVGIVYDLTSGSPREVFRARCTFGRVPGNKQRSGDNRTQEGVFYFDGGAIGNFGELYGKAFLNLADDPFPGMQIAGTGMAAREDAIRAGRDVTNGGVVFNNSDAVKIVRYAQEHGLNRGVAIIEHSARPVR